VCIMLSCVLSDCHGDCRYVLYLLVFSWVVVVIVDVYYTYFVFCRVVMEVVGMYCTYLCSLGLSW